MPFYKYQNYDLHFQNNGSGEIALLFVHGLGGDGGSWKFQVEYFKDRFRVITVDLFGHGRSSKEIDPVEAPRLDAEALVALMLNEIKQPYIVIGHSFASAILPEMIKLGDSFMKGVVFADCVYQGFEIVIGQRMSFASSMLAFSDEQLPEETRKWYLNLLAADANPDELELILSSLKNCDYRWLFQSVAGTREYNEKYPPGETPMRDNVQIFIMEADQGVGNDFKKSWVNHFKNARYYLFENSWHFFFITKHSKFNSLIDDFIEECL
nr:alpha/beta fold hydrolase [candidate division Zixibacteria bacterium]